jgi:hypothetical protein
MPREKIFPLEIRKAIMNGYGSSKSDPAIGITPRKLLHNDIIKITISQKDKDGQLIFPYEYEISCAEALNYPQWILPDGITPVHVIPIRRLTQLLTKANPKSFRTTMKRANTVAKRMADNNIQATIRPMWD